MNALQIVQAAIPDACQETADFILWGRTPFPVGAVSARDLYRAASAYHRASAQGIELCDWCPRRIPEGHRFLCERCDRALRPGRCGHE